MAELPRDVRRHRTVHRISSQLPPASELREPIPTAFRGRRRRLVPPLPVRLLLAIGVTVAVALPFGDGVGPIATPPAMTGLGLVTADARPQGAQAAAAAEHGRVVASFARVHATSLVLPSVETRAVAYHEAAFPDALPLYPVGRMLANDNPTKFRAPRAVDAPEYLVLSSRGRPTAATSAVDLVLDDGDDVRSVVSGEVSLVEPYLLYGRYEDTRLEFIPDGRPDLRVIVIHVEDVRVRPGDRVIAGETPIAGSANLFPFRSHVDRYVPGAPRPHVHVEVKSVTGAAESS